MLATITCESNFPAHKRAQAAMTRQPIRTITATGILAALTHPLASAPAAAQSDNTAIEAVTTSGSCPKSLTTTSAVA